MNDGHPEPLDLPDPGGLGRRRHRRSWWSALGPVAILGGSLALALAIYFGFLLSPVVQTVAQWTASWASAGLNALGGSTWANGTTLSSDSFAVSIVAECTAVGPLVVFVGAVLAYPTPLRAKALGAALGLVVLTGVNIVRIISLFWIGSAYPQYLGAAHLLVWQTAMIVLAVALWLFWVERLAGARKI